MYAFSASLIISTHTPLAGRDMTRCPCRIPPTSFLLTRPSRGATHLVTPFRQSLNHFYSHAPRGARPAHLSGGLTPHEISTHTPLAGRDRPTSAAGYHPTKFLLTRPSRGATDFDTVLLYRNQFLLTRPSRGATSVLVFFSSFKKFLLTRPSRGATSIIRYISTRAIFLLTRPSRGATYYITKNYQTVKISTHTPLAGRDNGTSSSAMTSLISTHTPLAGRDGLSPHEK